MKSFFAPFVFCVSWAKSIQKPSFLICLEMKEILKLLNKTIKRNMNNIVVQINTANV